MHLFAPERPEVTRGTKALLLDGSAIPHLLFRLEDNDTVSVQVLLRRQDNYGGYGWHSAVFPFSDIPALLEQFRDDPERTLQDYFDWTDKTHAGLKSVLHTPTVKSVTAGAELSPMEDLI